MRIVPILGALAVVAAVGVLLLSRGDRVERGSTAKRPSDAPRQGPQLQGAPGDLTDPPGDADTSTVVLQIVHDATGAGVSDAQVSVHSDAAIVMSRGKTDGGGRIRLTAVKGGWVHVKHPRFHPTRVPLPDLTRMAEPMRVELVGRGSLTVTVLDGRKESVPLSAASVEVEILGLGNEATMGRRSTGSNGIADVSSLPLGSPAIVRIDHPEFRSQVRRLDVEERGTLVVELRPAEFLLLSMHLMGFDRETLPLQRVALFHRDGDGTLVHVRDLDLMFREGRAEATLPWSHGAATLVGQLHCVLDRTTVGTAEAPVESTESTASRPRRRPGEDAVSHDGARWAARLQFDNLGVGLRVRFLMQTPQGGTRPAAGELIRFAREDSDVHGALTTDAEGRVTVPAAPGAVGGRFRFWLQRPGLVSQLVSLRTDGTQHEVVLANHGGDLVVRGWDGAADPLSVDGAEHGPWPEGIFAARGEHELVVHLPPGRYRLRSGATRLGAFEHEIRAGEATLVSLSGHRTASIHGTVAGPGEEVELLRSVSQIDRPVRYASTRSTDAGHFAFQGLPAGSYVVTNRGLDGTVRWILVQLGEGEHRDVGSLTQVRADRIEIKLVYENGRPARDQSVMLWEAPRGSGVGLRLAPDADGVIRCELPGRGDIAIFGAGWGAVLPVRTSPLELRLPSPGTEEQGLQIEQVSPESREVIVMCKEPFGVLGLVRRVGSDGLIRMSPGALEAAQYVWDEGWGFYRVRNRRAERPRQVIVPGHWIPTDAHSCRVVLVQAGEMNLLPLGWHLSTKLPPGASTDGLPIHVAAGWELQVDFLGGEGRSLRLAVRGDEVTFQER